ncbi:MAG: hypothetical protein QXO76_04375 [Thermoproteota archaeon]
MKARHLTPLLLLVSALFVGTALAATTITIPYTEFNAGMTEHPTGYASDTWSLRIINSLNFSNTSSIAKIFIANSTGTGFFAINVNLAPELNDPTKYSMDLFIASKVDPGPSDWTHIGMINNLNYGKAYYIRVDNAGTLTVTDGLKTLLTNPVNKFPAINIRTEGTESTATSGYVQVTVDKWFATPTETVNAWIPVIIVFAMVSMALGLMKRLSQ